jgi:hypothetical protein
MLALIGHAAHAELGGTHATVDSDQAHMRALLRQNLPNSKYHVEEMSLPRGTMVREYVSPSGQVFGVSWSGPAMPDLEQLLGSWAGRARQGVEDFHAAHGTGRGPAAVHSPDFMLQLGGRMGSHTGRAWLPAILPPGVTPDDIQ